MTASDSALLSYVRISNTEGIVNWRNSVGTDPVPVPAPELPHSLTVNGRFRRGNHAGGMFYRYDYRKLTY